MRLRDRENNEHNSTPKLALFSSFANRVKLQSPIGMATPPIHRAVAIPFRWEEAPGKPRPYPKESKPNNSASPTTVNSINPNTVRRCLDLPPRLLLPEANVTNMPSPTAVLDGPYAGCRSLTSSFSFRSSGGGCTDLQSRSKKLSRKERLSLSRSTRWGSFKKIKEVVKSSFDLSSSSSSTNTINNREGGSGGVDGDDGDGDAHCSKKKITRASRRNSLFNLTIARSDLFTSVYESVKQAVPWRRREEKVRKMTSSSESIV